jgi:NAD(P)-dependent dehydrogenase (short-subunit alcohol dehydrogenase family)
MQILEVDMADQNTAPILITGGTGFIGSYLATRLLEKKGNENEQVLLFDCSPDIRRLSGFNKRYKAVESRLAFVQGDFSSFELVLHCSSTNLSGGDHERLRLTAATNERLSIEKMYLVRRTTSSQNFWKNGGSNDY